MTKKYFKKERPNLTTLFQRLTEYGMQYTGFEEQYKKFGKEHEKIMKTIRENEDYALHRISKSGNVEQYYPFYDFWLNHLCDTFEYAIWHAVYSSEVAKGNKKAESVADQEAKKFVETMQ